MDESRPIFIQIAEQIENERLATSPFAALRDLDLDDGAGEKDGAPEDASDESPHGENRK